jgi:ABC-type branched-subunit amino acid transport system ATPase component
VTFAVAPHSIASVIGPNGAGKTSLFNTISGFYRPNSGTIRFKGEAITHLPAPARASRSRAQLSEHRIVSRHDRAGQHQARP